VESLASLIRDLEACHGVRAGVEASHGSEQLVEHKWKPPSHGISAKLGHENVDILSRYVKAQSFLSQKPVARQWRSRSHEQIRQQSSDERHDQEFDHLSHNSTVGAPHGIRQWTGGHVQHVREDDGLA
jgi:hypothetical protein